MFPGGGAGDFLSDHAEIQRDLDEFTTCYNTRRTHQGYGLNTRTPAQALRDALGFDDRTSLHFSLAGSPSNPTIEEDAIATQSAQTPTASDDPTVAELLNKNSQSDELPSARSTFAALCSHAMLAQSLRGVIFNVGPRTLLADSAAALQPFISR